jgi:hypothetical protein
MWEHCRAGQATDDNVVHAHCMLDTKGYKYIFRICNIYCFFRATMIARTRVNVTLYVLNFLYIGVVFKQYSYLLKMYINCE